MNFEDVLRHSLRINSLARSLIGLPAFEEVHVQLPDPTEPESGFIRAASWLYCLYFEAGRASIGFLCPLGEAYQLLDRDAASQHVESIRCLRTELHHNLGYQNSDQETRIATEAWKRKACGTAIPSNKEQWTSCYAKLLEEADVFLMALETLVRKLESDGEVASGHLQDWKRRLERNWSAASFDALIEDAASRLGRAALKVVAFRNTHVDRWRKQLQLLEDGFNFDREATLLIEKTLLDDESSVLPITGRDIIDGLGIQQGPEVGRLLEEAQRFYVSQRCGAVEIMNHLRTFRQTPPSG